MCIVSIIIPTYKGSSLKRAIESVLKQSYQYFELIIVDDNGLGTVEQIATEKTVKEYSYDKRVKYIAHKTNKNGSVARNKGVKASSGKYIALLDDDDEFTPDCILNHVKNIEALSDDYALTYCSVNIFLNNKLQQTRHAVKSGDVLYDLLIHHISISSSTLMIKRSVWDELNGFDETFLRHQDWEFCARVVAKYKVYAIDSIGVNKYLEFRNSPKSVERIIEYREKYLACIIPLIKCLPDSKQKDIIIYNRFDAAVQYLKVKRFKSFLTECKRIKPGYRGIKYLFVIVYNKLIKKR